MVSSLSFLFLKSAQALHLKEETRKGSSHRSIPSNNPLCVQWWGRVHLGMEEGHSPCHIWIPRVPLHTVPVGFLDWELPSSALQTKT